MNMIKFVFRSAGSLEFCATTRNPHFYNRPLFELPTGIVYRGGSPPIDR